MNLYEINKGSSKRHFVVTESFARAAELYEKEYGNEPEEITYIISYVIVDPKGIMEKKTIGNENFTIATLRDFMLKKPIKIRNPKFKSYNLGEMKGVSTKWNQRSQRRKN